MRLKMGLNGRHGAAMANTFGIGIAKIFGPRKVRAEQKVWRKFVSKRTICISLSALKLRLNGENPESACRTHSHITIKHFFSDCESQWIPVRDEHSPSDEHFPNVRELHRSGFRTHFGSNFYLARVTDSGISGSLYMLNIISNH
jgi:hypothetical protein